jgi:hypothetical protein
MGRQGICARTISQSSPDAIAKSRPPSAVTGQEKGVRSRMRVNVYREEITPDVQLIKTTAKTGAEYIGVRFYLHSATELHDERGIPDGDDDRSAVTFFGSKEELSELFTKALDLVYQPK